MSAFLLLFACNRVEPLDSEQICDGLDDDQDGFVDEGLFIVEQSFATDDAGVINVDRGFILRDSWVPGIEERSVEQVSSNGDVVQQLFEFDGSGNIIYAEIGSTSELGPVILTLYTQSFEGEELVYVLKERFEDDVLTGSDETVIQLTEAGLRETYRTEDLLDGDVLLMSYAYDEQGRLLSERSEPSDSACGVVYTDYDDTLYQSYEYRVRACDDDGDLEDITKTTSWDADGRVLSIESGEVLQSWSWQDDLASSYAVSDSLRTFEYQDGRLVGATADGLLIGWELRYDSLGRSTGYSLETSPGPSGVDFEYWGDQGSSLSRAFAVFEGNDSYERVYELSELGNLLGSVYESFTDGSTSTTTHDYTCAMAD